MRFVLHNLNYGTVRYSDNSHRSEIEGENKEFVDIDNPVNVTWIIKKIMLFRIPTINILYSGMDFQLIYLLFCIIGIELN